MTQLHPSVAKAERHIKNRNISGFRHKSESNGAREKARKKKPSTKISPITTDPFNAQLREKLTGRKRRLRGVWLRQSFDRHMTPKYLVAVGMGSGDYPGTVVKNEPGGGYEIETDEYRSERENVEQNAARREANEVDTSELRDLFQTMASQIADSREYLDRIDASMDATIRRLADYEVSIEQSKRQLGLGD